MHRELTMSQDVDQFGGAGDTAFQIEVILGFEHTFIGPHAAGGAKLSTSTDKDGLAWARRSDGYTVFFRWLSGFAQWR